MVKIKIEICLKKNRIKRGLSIVELARISGVSKTHISDIETGRRMPGLYVLCQLAAAMDLDVRELFTYRVEKK